MHHSEVDDNKTLLKVVNEIVHVYETREQIEFNDQTPLLDINPSKNGNVRPIIKEIQSSVSSMRGIARALTARGVKTARGGDWSDVQVAAILRR
jgi:methyl coenzyme M reductase beta subunit